MNENWKPVASFEQFYEVSDLGRIRSLRRQKCIKLFPNKHGYLTANLRTASLKKHLKVHTIVLRAFIGDKPHGMVGAHLNGNKLDNRLCNLRWCTCQENSNHMAIHGTVLRGEKHPRSRYKPEQVDAVRMLIGAGVGITKTARILGVGTQFVSHIKHGWTWKHRPNVVRSIEQFREAIQQTN